MRIVFITCDDVFYLPRFFRRVLGDWAPQTVGMVILPPLRSIKVTVQRSWALYGPWAFFVNSSRYAVRKAAGRLLPWVPACRGLSVEGVARGHSIPVYAPASVNAPEFVDLVRERLRPDLIVSVAASQIFKEPLLRIPSRGCINIHGALLPRYRGMLPSFWTLYNGEREGGVTVHYMNPGIDDGAIIAQRRFPILPGDTVEELIGRSKAVGADVLTEVIARIARGDVETSPNDATAGTYYSFPTRDDVRSLRARGRRVA